MSFRPRGFLECTGGPGSPFALLGLPFDGTCSFRPGCRFGPGAIREASWVLETYSPRAEAELAGHRVADLGDLDLPPSGPSRAVDRIAAAVGPLLDAGARVLGLGGEHMVTYPLVREHRRRHPGLTLLVFDAHADLRDEYLGERLSHATAARRCLEELGPSGLCQIGVRSGTREEFAWMRRNATLFPPTPEGVRSALGRTTGPLYLSLDLDVFDPGVLPGTGAPEPGGIGFPAFEACLAEIARSGRPVVGADVVELCPACDPTQASAVLAAKAVREILILMGAGE